MNLKKEFTIKERNHGNEIIRYDLNISFLSALIVLFADFISDYIKDYFNFRYYFFLKLILPIILFLIIRKLFFRKE